MRIAWGSLSLLLLLTSGANAATSNRDADSAFLEADDFVYNQENGTFTATGHVELEQEGQLVKADKMIYDRQNDVVYAEGNVTFIDKTGQTYFANKVRLEQKMKKGAIERIGLMFPDGSRFAAREGEQIDENKIEMRDGVYSPCNLCKEDPRKAPMWQLRADKMVHDKADQDIYYHNVKLDAYGVPIGYLPYFSHPDPNVVARSGFLMPTLTTDSKNGVMVRNYYYQNISPYEDVTLELSPSTKSGTLFGANWRRNFERGSLNFNGSLNNSDIRGGGSNSDRVVRSEKYRGHIFANGYYQIDSAWGTGFNLRRTSDNYYLGDFDYSNDDILQSSVYVERIKGRDYSNINATYFQDLRPDITQEQPDILPWAKHNMYGDPNEVMGGRWNLDNEFVTLFRDGDQSVSRISTVPNWERRDILPGGFQTTMNTKLRADGYWIRQNSPYDVVTSYDPNIDRTVSRLTPSAHGQLSYPMIRPSKTFTALIEPKTALTVAPNAVSNNRIPNEDSRDAQIDISNLFDDSRFPGVDRVENGSHASYGIKMGGYHENGNSTFITVGQSYRLTSENPFPEGSGLEEDRSDYVGQWETTFYDKFYTDYRFQLSEENLDSRRHELQAAYMGEGIELRTNYVFARAVQGTNLFQDRQQLGFSAAKTLTEKWAVGVDTLNDLTGESGLLKAGMALQYKNECLRFAVRAERDLTQRLTGGSDSRLLFSVGLRNLGGYDTPIMQNDPLYQPFGTTSKL